MMTDLTGIRCGIGYDTHRLAEHRPLVLGGVEILAARGLLAHSDGDVLCHAIADALLGAAGLGDIGQHFSDSDPRWKNARSLTFLESIRDLLAEKGLRVLHLDSIVVLDEPRLSPHIPHMIETLAAALGMDPARVSVKAKTSEGTALDLASAQAVVLVASR